MNHFAGIMAHKNPQGVAALINLLDELKISYAIHWDKKSAHLLQEHPMLKQFCIPSIAVNRGHISLVQAALLLMKTGINQNADYFHLISGDDLPCKSRNDWECFFKEHEGLSFLDHCKIPLEADPSGIVFIDSDQTNGDHIPRNHYNTPFLRNGLGMTDMRHFRPGSVAHRLVQPLLKFRTFQKIYSIAFKHKTTGIPVYAGSAWFTLHRSLLQILLRESSKERINQFSHCFYPDELFFQSLAMEFADRNMIINSDLRYIRWEEGSHIPAILGVNDIKVIQKSNGFFSRKWNFEPDTLKMVKKELLHV